MSSLKINKKDGSTTELNFKFDNGLPVKAIINPAYQEMYSSKENYYALSMYLTNDDLEKLGDLNIDDLNYSIEAKEVWLTINEHYVVFNELSDKIMEELLNKRLAICFYKEDETFIHGIKIG